MGDPVRRVVQFVEKPPLDDARTMAARGWLWNTLVLVGRVRLLIEAGWRTLPALSDRLARIKPFADSDDEAWVLHQAYLYAPKASFSRAVLETSPSRLALSPQPATVSWSDWGTPDRVLRSVRGAKVVPPWVDEIEHLGTAIDDAPSMLSRAMRTSIEDTQGDLQLLGVHGLRISGEIYGDESRLFTWPAADAAGPGGHGAFGEASAGIVAKASP